MKKVNDHAAEVSALLKELGARRYGLRYGWRSALARDLQIDPSTLTKLVRGGHYVGKSVAVRLRASAAVLA